MHILRKNQNESKDSNGNQRGKSVNNKHKSYPVIEQLNS